jgi:hypothetical protein
MTDFTSYSGVCLPATNWDYLLDHGLEKPAAYIIRKQGSNYDVINGSTGKQDDTNTTLSTSLNNALSSATAGDLVALKTGGQITDTVSIPEDVTLVGVGRPTLTCSDTSDPMFLLDAAYAKLRNVYLNMTGSTQRIGVRIKEDFCQLYGVDTAYGGTGIKVEGDDGGEIWVEKSLILNPTDYGIHCYRTTTTDTGGVYILNCLMGNGDAGVSTTQGLRVESTSADTWAYVWVINSIFDGIRGTNTAYLKNVKQTRIRNSWLTCRDSLTGSLLDINTCDDTFISECFFSNPSTGSTTLELTDVDGLHFKGNRVDTNEDKSVKIAGTNYKLLFLGNWISNINTTNYIFSLEDNCSIDSLQISENHAVGSGDAGDYFIYRGSSTTLSNVLFGLNNTVDITNFINTDPDSSTFRGFLNRTLYPPQGMNMWTGTTAGVTLNSGAYYVPNGVHHSGDYTFNNGCLRARGDGTISKFNVILDTAPGVGNERNFILYKNETSTSVFVNISGAATEASDESNELSFVDLDSIAVYHWGTSTPIGGSARWSMVASVDAWNI